MKAFQLPLKAQAKLVKATPHKEFDGKNPLKQAISLRLKARLSLALLRQFSPNAPDIFVRRRDDAEQQQVVDGVPPVLLELVAPDLALPVGFSGEFTGYTVTIDRAMGDIELYGCKVSKIKVDEPMPDGEHGSAVVEWSLGSDEKITPELVGLLCSMEGDDVWLGQRAPEKPAEEKAIKASRKKQEQAEAAGQQRLDGAGAAADPDAAGDAFAAAHGEGPGDELDDDGSGHADIEDDEDASPDLEDRLDNALRAADAEASGRASKAALDACEGSPFPRSETETPDREVAADAEETKPRRGRRAAASVE